MYGFDPAALDRWLTTEPDDLCPECGRPLPDGPDDDLPESERHVCIPPMEYEPEPPEVGDVDL